MPINITLFGQLAEIVGNTTLQLNNITNTNELQAEMQLLYPAFANARYAIAIDRQIVSENTTITDKTMVALLPPFSGG